MADRIHQLPDSVANKIAAGEVIQRPASVIKELVENSIDSGATDIHIVVRDGGRTLIQVSDNGCGMSATDARMAFERHATSKISSADDLFSLRTMGFRGEALPSICAISMVELKSRLRDSDIGTNIEIHGSKVVSQQADVCDCGTNIMVKNLFFNVPARRKFMKSDNVELSNIMKEFEKMALVNPGVKFSLDTGSKQISLRQGTLLQRIGEIWKGNIEKQLIPVEAETSTVRISGYVSRPEFARRRNPLQYLMVNGRNMRHPYFRKAILNSYNGLIAPDTQPSFFIKFEIDPSAIDVNIHPTKEEIKFEDEAVIWSVLAAAVKGALGKHSAVPSIDFTVDARQIDSMPDSKTDIGLPGYEIPLDYNPFDSAPAKDASRKQTMSGTPASGGSSEQRTSLSNWDKLYGDFMGQKMVPPRREPVRVDMLKQFPDMEEGIDDIACLQFADKYILCAFKGQIMLIDQYRAHYKILYEQIRQRIDAAESVSQALIFPELIEVNPEQVSTLKEVEDILRHAGLIVEAEGDDFVITGTPPGLTGQQAADMARRILDAIAESSLHYGAESPEEVAEELQNAVAKSMAQCMAVKRGRKLSDAEMKELIGNLLRLPEYSFTPDGRRVYSVLTEEDIERMLP